MWVFNFRLCFVFNFFSRYFLLLLYPHVPPPRVPTRGAMINDHPPDREHLRLSFSWLLITMRKLLMIFQKGTVVTSTTQLKQQQWLLNNNPALSSDSTTWAGTWDTSVSRIPGIFFFCLLIYYSKCCLQIGPGCDDAFKLRTRPLPLTTYDEVDHCTATPSAAADRHHLPSLIDMDWNSRHICVSNPRFFFLSFNILF